MFNTMRMTQTLAIAATALALTAQAHGDVIGNPLVNGSSTPNNLSSGNDQVLDAELPVGHTVATWSIYNDTAAVIGNKATPFLANLIGTNQNTADEAVPIFEIIAVGTTRTIDASGIQTWAFEVTSGSGVIGTNTYFGWRDGGVSADDKNGTIVEYSNGFAPPTVRMWFTHGSTFTDNDVAIGTTVSTRTSHSIATLFNRTYSAQVTTEIPEPTSLALVAMGGLMLVRRRARF